MITDVGPHDLASTALIVTPSGDAITKPLTAHGDEFVYLLEGDTDFILRTADGNETVRVVDQESLC